LKINKYILLHFIILLWGFTPVLGKLISLQALDLVWWRLVFAAVSLLAFIFYKKIALAISIKQLALILCMGIAVGMHWYFFYHAIKVSNVSIALAGFSTITLFASFMQPLLLGKKFFWGDTLYGVFIFVGLAIILHYEGLALEGLMYGILAAITGAFFGIYNGKLIEKHDSAIITFFEFTGALVLISLLKLFEGKDYFIPSLSMKDLIYLLILSIACTTLAFTLSVEILKQFSPFTVIITNNLEPVYGIVFSVLLFGQSEIMSRGFYIGAGILLFTVFTYPLFKKKFMYAA